MKGFVGIFRSAFLVACLWLAACSSSGVVFDPAPLPELPKNKEVWAVSVSSVSPETFPFMDKNKLWVGTHGGDVVVLSRLTGQQEMSFKASKYPVISVAVDQDRVFVVDDQGHLFAFDEEKGRYVLRWDRETDAAVSAPIFLAKDRVLLRLNDGRILAFNRDGKLVWQQVYLMPELILKAPFALVGNDQVVFQSVAGGIVRKFSLQDGTLLWEQLFSPPRGVNEGERITDFVNGGVLLSNRFCVGAFQGKLGCMDTQNGNSLWDVDFSSPLGITASLNTIISVGEKSDLVAKRFGSGSDKWQQTLLRYRHLTSMKATDDWVAVTEKNGSVHFFDVNSGEALSRYQAAANVRIFGVWDGDLWLVSSGRIYRIAGAVR
jgi:outer membrane protein assembly factor BamB